MLETSPLLGYVPDLVLILISGSACLYCVALNRKLKNLNNLKTGVGASIVSLTEAIAQTHEAAQTAQTTTLQTTEALRHLLQKAESAGPKVEAHIAALEKACATARKDRKSITTMAETDLSQATVEARKTAAALLNIIKEVSAHNSVLEARLSKNKEANADPQDAKQEKAAIATDEMKTAEMSATSPSSKITDFFAELAKKEAGFAKDQSSKSENTRRMRKRKRHL